ncbi:MAG: pilus assembly protein PilM [Aeromicrobium sp.]|nr:pilus assembly protein PilM [Burkholderiales bacterium]
MIPAISTLSSPVSGNRLLQLWRWWTAELRAMLPALMARWIDGDAVAINVMVDERGLTILNTRKESGKPHVAERVSIDTLASNPLLRDLIEAGRDRVRLVLTPDQAMVKSITLPIATEENLREVVGFELDRHTPFTPDQAYFDAQIVRRDTQQEKIVVTLVVASRGEVASLLDMLTRAGLTCASVGIDDTAAENAAAVDLQPLADKPPRRLSRVHQINIGLLVLAVLLALVAIVLPIWQKRETVKELIPQAEKSGAEFLISERVFSEYTKLAAEYNFLASRKHAAYPVVSVLEELARTFPDTTWVQKLDIKPNGKVREVILLGEAQSTSKVIENLEQSPMSLFRNSEQKSATTSLQLNRERFHVSTEIKPRPLPVLEVVEDATSVAAPAFPAAPNAPAPVGGTNPLAPAGLASPATTAAGGQIFPTPTPTATFVAPIPLTGASGKLAAPNALPAPGAAPSTVNGPPGQSQPTILSNTPFNPLLTPMSPPQQMQNPPAALPPPNTLVPTPSSPPGK